MSNASKVTFGGEGTLKLFKRVNCQETISFTFKDENGDPYIYPTNYFSFIVKKNFGDKKNVFELDSSSGLVLNSNVLEITINANDSNINEGEYYYQLKYSGQVRINGNIVFYNGTVNAAN
jgi:hypothetical protein